MDISTSAQRHPDKSAVLVTDPLETRSYGELDLASQQIADRLHGLGLRAGDGIAVLMQNEAAFFAVTWAAQRSGLYYTTLNPRFTQAEASYVVSDSGSRVLLCSDELKDMAIEIARDIPGLIVLTAAEAGVNPGPDSAPALEGADMLYSSGTTGRPKGVRQPLSGAALGMGSYPLVDLLAQLYGMSEQSVYLSPAPLYHSAPLRFCLAAHRLGAQVIAMRRFDPEQLLALIAAHRVTHVQMVPTMLVRLLKLPESTRRAYDLSSLQAVVHAAAPCPEHVKAAVIDWLGPIVHEYYSGTEGVGFCAIHSHEWLSHRGSVGRPLSGVVHICDDSGAELAIGEVGTVWFETAADFVYHGDPEKTAAALHPNGWRTLGDLGRVDAEGFLYLADRRVDLILSGGVNIYPQEVEDVLLAHPGVLDAAVVGLPDEEYGEQVVAFVHPVSSDLGDDALLASLIELCRGGLASYKIPRRFTIVQELPRYPDGKLRRRLLKDVG